MARKSSHYWSPEAKGHLAAASLLNRAAPHLSKSPPVVAKKLASFRAAAKLAHAHQQESTKPPPKIKTVNSMTPEASSPTPNAKPVVAPMKKAPTPPKVPTTP